MTPPCFIPCVPGGDSHLRLKSTPDGRTLIIKAIVFMSHCGAAVALLDGAARVFVQLWISVTPRALRGAHVVREGALSHGRTEEKDLPVARGHASQSPGADARGACRMRQLRRTEAAASRVQPLWPLRRARSCRSREAATGRCTGLRPGRGVRPVFSVVAYP